MGKKDKIVNDDYVPKKLKLRARCGGCVHLRIKAPGLEDVCSRLGKTVKSPGCELFTPDYSDLRLNSPTTMMQVGKMIANMPDHVKHLVAYSIVNSLELERTTEAMLGEAIQFGQPLAVNLSIPKLDYLNCWFRCVVVGITQDKTSLILLSELEGSWAQTIVPFTSDLIMTRSQFQKHSKKLVKDGKINAPKKSLRFVLPKIINQELPERMATLSRPTVEATTRKTLKAPEIKSKVKVNSLKKTKDKKGKTKITIIH